ncbi:MAG: hypothetical protein J6X45_00665 [Lachnospiraceae bacterium]|nr:hypothetical protein [Lachnospiraceae bacterium]
MMVCTKRVIITKQGGTAGKNIQTCPCREARIGLFFSAKTQCIQSHM